MVYLKRFELLDDVQEHYLFDEERRHIFNSYYPVGLFSMKKFKEITFSNITIFYGGNGSGKSTLLNIISECLHSSRKENFDKGAFFDLYASKCKYDMSFEEPMEIKTITSDDVFDYLLDIRSINANVNRRKERLSREYLDMKFNSDNNFDNYERLKDTYDSKRKSMSSYVRNRLGNNNIVEQSNGESARFYNCQFIISTHSPFLLNLLEAKIYDLDEDEVTTKNWTELPNVRIYYDFFNEHKNEFKKND